MKRNAKVVGAAIAATVLGLTVSSCSGGTAGDEGVTLTLWHNTQDPDAILNLYEAYEEESGNTIELIPISSDGFEEATLSKWASGDRPDILEFHGVGALIDLLNGAQNLQDLSDMSFVEASGDLYDISGRGADGNVYAAITSFPEVWGLYYNKSILAEHGLEPATTYEELLAQCGQLSAAGVTTIAESGASIWPPQALPHLVAGSLAPEDFTERVITQETTLDAPDSPVLEAMEDYQTLIDDGCLNSDVSTATFEDSVSKVYEGEAAYQPLHSNIASVYLDAAGGDPAALDEAVGFTAFGGESKATAVNPGPIGTYLLPKTGDSAKEQAAQEFLEFATGEYHQTYVNESGTFPVIEGVDDPADATPLLQAVKAAYDEGPQFPLVNANLPGGMQGWAALLSELLAGQKSPSEVASSLQGQLATAAKSQGLEGW
ncbi:extracellular solute-binding protein [Okibacterium endophyticum]